jgi:hypothetical protein
MTAPNGFCRQRTVGASIGPPLGRDSIAGQHQVRNRRFRLSVIQAGVEAISATANVVVLDPVASVNVGSSAGVLRFGTETVAQLSARYTNLNALEVEDSVWNSARAGCSE